MGDIVFLHKYNVKWGSLLDSYSLLMVLWITLELWLFPDCIIAGKILVPAYFLYPCRNNYSHFYQRIIDNTHKGKLGCGLLNKWRWARCGVRVGRTLLSDKYFRTNYIFQKYTGLPLKTTTQGYFPPQCIVAIDLNVSSSFGCLHWLSLEEPGKCSP